MIGVSMQMLMSLRDSNSTVPPEAGVCRGSLGFFEGPIWCARFECGDRDQICAARPNVAFWVEGGGRRTSTAGRVISKDRVFLRLIASSEASKQYTSATV